MEDKKYHYLHVNRGRYLCRTHGAFCDKSDNYTVICPLCKSDNKRPPWEINNIDRALQLVNGLQERSKRNVAIVSTIIGGIGTLKALNKINEYAKGINNSNFSNTLLIVAILFFIGSVGFYASSMKQLSILDKNSFPELTLTVWEEKFAKEIKNLEQRHSLGAVAFLLGLLFLAISLFGLLPAFFPKLPS